MTILCVIFSLIILFSASMLGVVVTNKKAELFLPISATSIIVILFLCGLCGNIFAGMIILIAFGFCCYAYALYAYIKSANKKEMLHDLLKKVCTPTMFIFLIFSILFFICTFDCLFSHWDEFSHWGDIVKVMVTIDDFGTNPLAQSAFQSYPPGASLFEYFGTRLYYTFSGNFIEWPCLFFYDILSVLFLLPIVSRVIVPGKKLFVPFAVSLFLAPTFFIGFFYCTIYVDTLLAIISGCAFAYLLLAKKDFELYDILYIVCACINLVLIKDAGLLLAIFVALACIILIFIEKKMLFSRKMIFSIVIVLSVMLPKIAWALHVKMRGAHVNFSAPYNFREIFAILRGKVFTYRTETLHNFVKAFFNILDNNYNTNVFIFPELKISAFVWALVLFAVIAFFLFFTQKNQVNNERKFCFCGKYFSVHNAVCFLCMGLVFCIFVVGLGFSYMYKFSEYEAVRLASFARYLQIVYGMLWIVAYFLLVDAIMKMQKNIVCLGCFAILIASQLFATRPKEINYYMSRNFCADTITLRNKNYPIIQEKVNALKEKRAKLYIIVQESKGFEYWVMRFSLRPHIVKNGWGWSIGEPFYEGDVWTVFYSLEQWQKILQEYDYVVLYNINDYFIQTYGPLFENVGDIANNTVFSVDKEKNYLVLVQ